MADREGKDLHELGPVLDTALDAVIVIRADGTIAEWNRIAEQVFGWSRNEAMDRLMGDLIIPPRDRQRHDRGLKRYIAGADPTILNQRIEVTALRRSGEIFPVELSITETQVCSERLFVGFLRDISLRKRAEAVVARRADEAELLFNLARLAGEAEDVEDALSACLQAVCDLTGWPVGHALVVAPAEGGPALASTGVWHGKDDPRLPAMMAATAQIAFAEGTGLPGAILASGEPLWIGDIEAEPRFLRAGLGFGAAFGFPIVSAGKTIAVLEFFSGAKSNPDPDLLLLARTLGAHLGRVLERQFSNAALSKSEERLRLALDAARMVNWEVDLQTATLSGSPELASFLGLPLEELTLAGVRALYHPGERERVLAAARQAWDAGEADFEAEVGIKDGRSKDRSILLRAHIEADMSGQPGRMIGVLIDVTERRKAEEQLRSSEQRFRLLVQGVTDYAIFMLDPDGRVASWNAGAERIKGYAAEEIVGKHFSLFLPHADRASGQAERSLEIAAREGRFEKEGWRLRKDGTRFWANIVIDPIRDEQGELVGFAKITRDITERAQLRESQKLAALGQLTGGMAHDFNNLLAVVIGNLDLVDEDAELGSETRELVDSARKAGLKGAELIRQLLAFSRRQTLAAREFDLSGLVRDTTDLLRRLLGEAVEIRTRLAADLQPALADPTQVESALTNLAVNARDAMPDGGTLTIETSSVYLDEEYAAWNAEVTPGAYLMLAVSDTGTGIPPEILGRICEPFFTTKAEGKGTGLGLSMVYGFARQSGGHLKIYSEPGHGTTVRFYIPSAQGADLPVAIDEEAAASPGSGVILVVEDSSEVRRMVARQLRGLGYQVHEAEDSGSALEILGGDERIDLLFTDMVMPGGTTGDALADMARKMRPEIKVLFTSGFAEIGRGGGSPGPVTRDNLLSKPYRKQELAARVGEMLRGREA